MKKSKTSAQWLKAHEDDEFVKRARKEGYRSRASYKLIEIDDKYQLMAPGMTVIDLGASPGGWSQVARRRVGPKGRVIAVDVLPMDPLEGVSFIEGDFTEEAVLVRLAEVVAGRKIDLVISDMAPNLSGMKDIDQPRAMYLVELSLDLVDRMLAPGGGYVAKCFEGEGIDSIRTGLKQRFRRVINFKPKASRGKSREIYVIGCGHT
ncbi:MAG: RlmE family RNA methyltransferase [Pseudomonadales bacterium]